MTTTATTDSTTTSPLATAATPPATHGAPAFFDPPPLPRAFRATIAAISLAGLITSAVLVVAAAFLAPKPLWMLVGFEVVTLVAAVLGLRVAAGKHHEGQALGIVCIAGTFAVAGFLGWLSLSPRGSLATTLRPEPFTITTLTLARLAAAALLATLATLAVFRRNPACWRWAARAALTGGPLLALLALAAWQRGPIMNAVNAVPGPLAAGIAGLVALIAAVLLCAAVHCTVNAFNAGRTIVR